ncbi:hypothetical protein [Streptomyces sp. NRRL B-24484]|uniref:hypothetical protein n=1 Tax=Streptomyces sp. NRRL B-24484 TaxID=1463833 RepID=UPI0004C1886B|nr:hypothetical protein [Streptomyces sp. NRRL B-24484]
MADRITLRFNLSAVLALAEHAATASAHQGYGGLPPVPALVWARMNGTFLTSNGRPSELPDIYAEGRGPGTGEALAETPVGGDDFGQMIPVDSPVELADGRTATLLEWLRESHGRSGRGRRFLLEVTADSLGFAVE